MSIIIKLIHFYIRLKCPKITHGNSRWLQIRAKITVQLVIMAAQSVSFHQLNNKRPHHGWKKRRIKTILAKHPTSLHGWKITQTISQATTNRQMYLHGWKTNSNLKLIRQVHRLIRQVRRLIRQAHRLIRQISLHGWKTNPKPLTNPTNQAGRKTFLTL